MLAAADQSLDQRSGIVSNGAEVLNKAYASAATTSKHSAEVRFSPQDASADEQPLQHQSSLSSVGPDYADAVKRDTNTGWQRAKTAKRKPKNKIVIGVRVLFRQSARNPWSVLIDYILALLPR